MVDYNSTYTGAQIDANLAKAATAVQPTNNATVLGSGSATNGQVLAANGSGGTSWATASGGGTPGGTDTQVQFNDGGAFGGDSGFTFDKTNNTLGLGGGTITASDPIIDMAQTWNNAAVTFTALKANVTDTASAAGSLLMDLQVGGVSRASVRKDGRLFGNSYYFDSLNGVILGASNQIMMAIEGAGAFHSFRTSHFMVGSNVTLRWSSDSSLATNTIATSDLVLARDAANTLAQRNGVNAQAFNLYGTYTDASNYERGFMRFVSNVLEIGTGAAGTGTGRDVSIKTQSGRYLTLSNNTTLDSNAVYTRFYAGTTAVANINVSTQQIVLSSSGAFTFSSGADSFGTSADTGMARSAAGVAKITNGSTGTGQLIFIVPTTNPGITGALWNNAGTLAIS